LDWIRTNRVESSLMPLKSQFWGEKVEKEGPLTPRARVPSLLGVKKRAIVKKLTALILQHWKELPGLLRTWKTQSLPRRLCS